MRGQVSNNPKNKTELADILKTKIAITARAIPIKHIISKLFIFFSLINRLLRKDEEKLGY